MSHELEFEDLQYDNGYGGVDGTLIIEVNPIYTDCSHEYINTMGSLSTQQAEELVDVAILGATFFAVDQDGGDLAEYTFDALEISIEFKITKDQLINKLLQEVS